jgi:hypothetical protein
MFFSSLFKNNKNSKQFKSYICSFVNNKNGFSDAGRNSRPQPQKKKKLRIIFTRAINFFIVV